MQLRDNTFLITGGGSGLGAACARRIVERGGRVVLADINPDAASKLAQELGEHARFQQTDVTSEDSVKAVLDFARPVAGVIQCAGVVHGEKVVGRNGPHDLAAFARVIHINLIGTFNVMRLAAQVLEANSANEEGERGVIVNTASVAAFEGQIGQAAYAASKGGVASLTLPCARELSAKGIRVVAIAPGIFDTPMMAGMPQNVRDSLGQQVPFPSRLGRPEEFAQLVEQICENVMLNGCVIRLDGALRMGVR